MKFFRIINNNYPQLKFKFYKNATKEELEELRNEYISILNNCHWGQLKLFYTEFEFLELISQHIDLSTCLILYVGAADGSHLNLLLEFYPMINLLLYDPNEFKIKESKNVIIKTGNDGFFSDEKIPEVLNIANGRKIVYISDIRLTDEDEYKRQKVIYNDMIIQQRWAITMSSEFMLFKFRMFYYKESPKEVDFIDNSYVKNEFYNKNTIIEDKTDIKFDDMLYLFGKLYLQIYSPTRSGETRLYVSKIKYHKDAKLYTKEEQNKYKMTYYNNIKYESQLNYFNVHDRNKQYKWGHSDKMALYIPGMNVNYASACEYYLIYRYLKRFNLKKTFNEVLNVMIKIILFMNTHYNNNLVICQSKAFKKILEKKDYINEIGGYHIDKYIVEVLENTQKKFKEQIKNLNSTNLIDKILVDKLIKSYNKKSEFYNIYNGEIIIKYTSESY